MRSNQIQIDECYVHYIESQLCDTPAGTIIFLHGFPENWRTWRKQISHFSTSYRVIAPDLPGYGRSSQPAALSFYSVPNLINVMRRFIEFVSEGQNVILVAHDWGGAIAWPLAAFHGDLLSKLVIINAAHPSTFTREMNNNPKQRRKSDYIHDLIARNAEQQIVDDNYSLLKNMFTDERGKSVISSFEMNEYLHSWQSPGTLTSMLNYYRAMPQLAPRQLHDMPPVSRELLKVPNIRVAVPTLVLWGEQDLAFVPQLLDGLANYVKQLKIIRFARGNHWLHHQFPNTVNEHIDRFLLPT